MKQSLSKYTIFVASMAVFVTADWASLDNKLTAPGCAQGGPAIPPFFEDDAWDSVCDDLVADGCATAFVTGNANVGGSEFARNSELDCAANAPAGQLTCTNAFRDAYAQCGGSFSSGATTSCSLSVFDGDGQSIGVIGIIGSCLPAPAPPRD